MYYEVTKVESKSRAGDVSIYEVPQWISLDDFRVDIVELCDGEENALELVNTLIRRRVTTATGCPWVLGTSHVERSPEERKARLKAGREKSKAERTAKDNLLRDLLSGNVSIEELKARIAAMGVKA